MPFVDILIFAIIAIFLGIRLKNILGTRDGYEQTPDEMQRRQPMRQQAEEPAAEAMKQAKIVPLHPDALSGDGVEAIKRADPSFQEDQFLQGAAAAFAMVLHAFAEGDLSQLRRLLGYDLFNEFSETIRQRNADNESLSLEIVSLDDVQLLNAELVDGIASVSVKFTSVQKRTYFDGSGNEIIDDEPNGDQETLTDIWVFERDTQVSDPNWKLVETGA